MQKNRAKSEKSNLEALFQTEKKICRVFFIYRISLNIVPPLSSKYKVTKIWETHWNSILAWLGQECKGISKLYLKLKIDLNFTNFEAFWLLNLLLTLEIHMMDVLSFDRLLTQFRGFLKIFCFCMWKNFESNFTSILRNIFRTFNLSRQKF